MRVSSSIVARCAATGCSVSIDQLCGPLEFRRLPIRTDAGRHGGTVRTRKEPGRWSGSRYIAIKYLLKLNYFLKRSIAQLNHKLRTPICCVATIFVAACYTKVYSSRSFTEDGPRMI